MNKLELSAYLCNLHTLMEAQTKGIKSTASPFLADEYTKHWGLLEEAIAKENDDETRKSDTLKHERNQDRAPKRGD